MAARDALAKELRTAGDRDGAAAVRALRRPSMAAWYANVAARASLVSLREWLALGASMRAAQADLDMGRVRSLSAGRASLESRVVRDLSAHLRALGVPVSSPALEEVRGTLRAALADAAAADIVASGRLERTLSYGGFGEVDVSAALAALVVVEAASSALDPPGGSTREEPPEEARPQSEPEPGTQPEPEPQPDPALVAAVAEARGLRDRAEAALAVAQRELREARARLREAERALAGDARR